MIDSNPPEVKPNQIQDRSVFTRKYKPNLSNEGATPKMREQFGDDFANKEEELSEILQDPRNVYTFIKIKAAAEQWAIEDGKTPEEELAEILKQMRTMYVEQYLDLIREEAFSIISDLSPEELARIALRKE